MVRSVLHFFAVEILTEFFVAGMCEFGKKNQKNITSKMNELLLQNRVFYSNLEKRLQSLEMMPEDSRIVHLL